MNRRLDLLRWEFFLVAAFIGFNVVMAVITPYYLSVDNLLNMTTNFIEEAMIALVMTFIIITGEIDISVASILALSSVVMASLFSAGLNIWLAALVGLAVGTACGFINGYIVTRFQLSSMIVTLASFSLFRGIAYVILGDQSVTGYPNAFAFLGQGTVFGPAIPFSLVVFIVLAIAAGIILRRSRFGRMVYAIGWNQRTCRASGIPVRRIKILLFTLSGLISAFAGVFLTSRISSTRPNIATGFELDVITMVILGGVTVTGGNGKLWGVILALFFVGFVRYGLGLNNIPAQYMPLITGLLLISSIVINNAVLQRRQRRLISSALESQRIGSAGKQEAAEG